MCVSAGLESNFKVGVYAEVLSVWSSDRQPIAKTCVMLQLTQLYSKAHDKEWSLKQKVLQLSNTFLMGSKRKEKQKRKFLRLEVV